MKKKDITLLAVVIIISAVLSFFIADYVIGDPESNPIEAEVVEVISTEFSAPNEKFFNQDSLNPTQLIRVGDEDGNTTPFGQNN